MRSLEDSPFDYCCCSSTSRYYTVLVTESLQLLSSRIGVTTTFGRLEVHNLLITLLFIRLAVMNTILFQIRMNGQNLCSIHMYQQHLNIWGFCSLDSLDKDTRLSRLQEGGTGLGI